MGRTLAEKVWDDHVVVKGADGTPDLIYIDLHLVHEVTSPQAFDGLRQAGRGLRRTDLTVATEDHNTPTLEIDKPIQDPTSRKQIETLRHNAAEFGVRIHSLGDKEQGIVHLVGPQLGLTLPGVTVVCGDSHTSTHGAFGAMAFGIGTSEVEHVMATQTLPLKPFKTMAINVEGELRPGVRVLVVPGSARVRLEAEAAGLDKVFTDFGAEWRFAGCSMCLGMNPDQLAPGERCASTSNRNFEGRQGKGGRTHLVSPLVAAATAVRGTLSSPSDLDPVLTSATAAGVEV